MEGRKVGIRKGVKGKHGRRTKWKLSISKRERGKGDGVKRKRGKPGLNSPYPMTLLRSEVVSDNFDNC